ncbi:hypothetical protein [Streptomyces sp. NPDC058612]|uniref:hypothetical protein n=1 Tax=Streptomyces sp. NPDC058612 TaxID=3346555 RepID=UPI0036686994
MPRDLDLGRTKPLEQLGVSWLVHATIVGLVKDVLPETQVGLLVGSRQLPLLAARWTSSGTRVALVSSARSWPASTPTTPSGTAPSPPSWAWLVEATLRSLTTPPSAPAFRVRVSRRPRSRSTPRLPRPLVGRPDGGRRLRSAAASRTGQVRGA